MDEDEAARVAEKTYQQFKDKPDAMVERKIEVIRGPIASGQDVEYNEARMAGLDRVVHERERRKRGREGRDEVRSWSAEARGWVIALGALGVSGLVVAFWNSLTKWFGG